MSLLNTLKKKRVSKYMLGDIKSVSISCGCMNYFYSYSFYLRKVKEVWLLDVEFATDVEQPRVEYEECPVEEEDVEALLEVVQKHDVIEKLRSYKTPKIKVHVLDETTYYTLLCFTNEEKLGAATLISKDLEECFYRLAKKYSSKISERVIYGMTFK